MAFLEPNHIQKIFTAYQNFTDIENFARLVDIEKVLSKNGNMAINLYVRPKNGDGELASFEETYDKWKSSSEELKQSMTQLFQILEN